MHRRHILHVVLALVGAVVFSTGWALASPFGASPDEAAHIVYSYGVATGQTLPGEERLEPAERGPVLTRVQVPGELLDFDPCYALDPDRPASCPHPARPETMSTTTYHTRYPPPYYLGQGLLMRAGLGVGLDGDAVLALARVASGVSALAMVGFAIVALVRRFHPAIAILAVLAAITPGGLSLFAAINPNGVEIAAAILTAALVVAARSDDALHGRTSTGLRAGLVVAFTALSWARPLSVVWAGLLFAVLVWPSGPPRTWAAPALRRLGPVATALVAVNFAAALAWIGYEYGTRQVLGNVGGDGAWTVVPWSGRIVLVLLKPGDLIREMIGAIGWDVLLPDFFVLGWLLATAALFWTGAGWGHRRGGLTGPLTFLLASAAVVAAYSLLTGFGWQGRYWMPAVAAFLILAVPALGRGSVGIAPGVVLRRHAWILVVFLTFQAAGFVWHMWRLVYGVRFWYARFDPTPLPIVGPQWSPVGGQKLPIALYALGLAAMLVTLALHLRAKRALPDRQVADAT